jgi:hypothetical protein
MKRLLLLLLLLVCPLYVFAMTSADAVITTMVSERAPVDRVEVYPAQQGTLYCFTRIEGAIGETSVDHVWLYQGKEMARVTLPVRSAKWRTYSSKKIVPEWKGEWEVRVVDPADNELTSARFRVE